MTLLRNGSKKSKYYIYIYTFIYSLGIDMDAIKIKRNPPINLIHPIPPYNGFGSEEDSMLNVQYLDPNNKVHEKFTERFKRDKHILRFTAKLISSYPCDDERTFIISFFLRDLAVQVYEMAPRNSGRIQGKFFERQRVKNPYTKKYYLEKDFVVGNVIYINKYIFKLMECDDYTKKYQRDNADIFKQSDIVHVLSRLRINANKFETFEEYLVKMLKCVDPQGRHFVSKKEISEGFKEFGLFLSPQEIITLTEKLRMNDKEEYSMEDLYNLVAFE